ncbi:MAG: glycosyltransferase family 39 protein [Candidatus Omnitrophota bacterium]
MDVEHSRFAFIRRRALTALGLIALLALALWLRIDSLDWGMPFRLHPDEWKYVSGAAKCHQGEWNPKYFRNPPGFTYLNALFYPLWLRLQTPVEVPAWLGIDPQFLKPSDNIEAEYLHRPFDLTMGSRMLAAIMGALTAAAVYLLARERCSQPIAMIAALLSAVSFANVRESHFAVNDSSMTLFLTLSLWLGLFSMRRGSFRLSLVASALAGIAAAMKYSAAPLVPVLMVFWGAAKCQTEKKNNWKSWMLELLAIGGLSLACFFAICPFPISDPSAFWPDFWEQYRRANILAPGQEKTGFALLALNSFLVSEGWASVILAIVGFGVLVKQRRWEWLIFPLLFFAVLAKHSMFFIRYCMPIMPWISLWAAVGIDALAQRANRRFAAVLLASALTIACLIEPLAKDIRANWLLKQTDTRIECMRWFLEEGNKNGLMAVDQYSIPISYKSVSEPLTNPFRNFIWIDRLPSKDLTKLDAIENAQAAYIAVGTFAAFPGGFPDSYEERRTAIKTYAGGNKPIKRFIPFEKEWNPAPADLEDTYTPVSNLWGRNQPGPAIEIFTMSYRNQQ